MIDDSLTPPDGLLFKSEPLTQFDQSSGTIATFCLPEEAEFEFFLRLDTVSTDGNSVTKVSLNGLSELAFDENESTDPSFVLYYRGKLAAGDSELSIAYDANTAPLKSGISNENGFSWGYHILGSGIEDVVDANPSAC
mmetsp:Transcript_9449/g.12848  ORF Transcript_9449/g.12848 Transcript_9449/m.12848 type:complete len:138 (-) Transcript_9449:158-571(-)